MTQEKTFQPQSALARSVNKGRTIVLSASGLIVWLSLTSSTRCAPSSPVSPQTMRCAHTPPAGSGERAAIMDALRGSVLRATGQNVIFVVRHLKVSNGWAWTVVNPKSAKGAQLEPLAALMRRGRNGWMASRVLNGDEFGIVGNPRALRRMFPNAPADIFAGSHL